MEGTLLDDDSSPNNLSDEGENDNSDYEMLSQPNKTKKVKKQNLVMRLSMMVIPLMVFALIFWTYYQVVFKVCASFNQPSIGIFFSISFNISCLLLMISYVRTIFTNPGK